MATKVDIVNAALTELGADSISSFQEDGKAPALARLDYDRCRDAVLGAYPWTFADARAGLTASGTSPVYGYTNAYDLPEEPAYCLRVLEVDGESIELGQWTVEGRQLVANLESTVNILYTKRVHQTGLYSANFIEAFSAYLALRWCEPLVKSASLKSELSDLYQHKLRMARSADAQQGTPKVVQAGYWTDVR